MNTTKAIKQRIADNINVRSVEAIRASIAHKKAVSVYIVTPSTAPNAVETEVAYQMTEKERSRAYVRLDAYVEGICDSGILDPSEVLYYTDMVGDIMNYVYRYK